MTPVEEAKAVYDREPCARSFREDLEAHLLTGYVWSSPTAFGMCRAVRRDLTQGAIVNPWIMIPPHDCDAWLIYLAAGDLDELAGKLPYPLPFIGWERENVLRWYPFRRIARHYPDRLDYSRLQNFGNG